MSETLCRDMTCDGGTLQKCPIFCLVFSDTGASHRHAMMSAFSPYVDRRRTCSSRVLCVVFEGYDLEFSRFALEHHVHCAESVSFSAHHSVSVQD